MIHSGIMCDKILYMQFSPYGAVVEVPSTECSFHTILTSFLDFFCHTLYLKRIFFFFVWVLKVAGEAGEKVQLGKYLPPKHRICVHMPCTHAEIHIWFCTVIMPVLGVEADDPPWGLRSSQPSQISVLSGVQ